MTKLRSAFVGWLRSFARLPFKGLLLTSQILFCALIEGLMRKEGTPMKGMETRSNKEV